MRLEREQQEEQSFSEVVNTENEEEDKQKQNEQQGYFSVKTENGIKKEAIKLEPWSFHEVKHEAFDEKIKI